LSSIQIAGNTSGTITLDAPAVAGTTTLTLPATSGTVIVNSGAQTIEFADGSAGAPSITNSGDTNTGIFFPAADTIAFAEGGAESMRIDSSGNVGIGTSSPASQLQIYPSSASIWTEGLRVNREGQTGQYGIFNYSSGNCNIIAIDSLFGNPSIRFLTSTNGSTETERMRIDPAGALILAGSTAQKATGTTWSNPSDQRLKDNIRDYTKGTAELMQVRVREWEYNGKGGTTEGLKGLGVVADEVMTVLPNTVETYNAKLNADDEEDTEIKKFDATEITWLLVKTVQELKAELDNVKTELATLKGAPQ
jgi:hypothetical protein